jgi:hypothetical protein
MNLNRISLPFVVGKAPKKRKKEKKHKSVKKTKMIPFNFETSKASSKAK